MEIDLSEFKLLLTKSLPHPSKPRSSLPFTEFNLPNQRIIKTDVIRTKTGILSDDDMYNLEWLLTLYCKESSTSYKQGMNEIFVTFLMLTRKGVDLSFIYELGKNFIDICMINMFKDADFRPAQAMFSIINLILKYQEPVLFNHLTQYSVTPELYATSWFLTFFATKIPDYNLVLVLWREIILQKDQIFPCYLAVSLLKLNEEIIMAKKLPNAAQAISRVTFQSIEEINAWISQAKQLKWSLPCTWKLNMTNIDIHNLQNIGNLLEQLRGEVSLMVSPQELLPYLYPEYRCCCKNNSCVWCKSFTKVDGRFIVVDCRLDAELQGGSLPDSHKLHHRLWNNPYIIKEYVDNFDIHKGRKHITLLCSSELVEKNYQFNQEQSPANSQEMLIALFTSFIEKDFPYISIVKGGFKACHELMVRTKLEIVDHSKVYCQVCNPERPATGFKKFTKSMSEVLKSTFTKVSFSFGGNKMESSSMISVPEEYLDSKAFICRKFDKVTHDKSDEEFSLLIMPKQVILARFMNHNPKRVIKTLEEIAMMDLLKITSMKKFPNVLTFCVTTKQICLIFNDTKDSKDCITLVTKLFRELKSSS